jgi:hypothetical protein
LRKELRLRRHQDCYRCLVDPTCQATQETQCSIIPSCTRGSFNDHTMIVTWWKGIDVAIA